MVDAPGLTWEVFTLKFHHPFRLSTGVSTTRKAYWIRLKDDQGWGEGTIPPYYNIPDQEMIAVWERAAVRDEPFPDRPEDIPGWVGESGPPPARAAVDLALHDRIGRMQGKPLYRILGMPRPKPRPTAFTIAISSPEKMAELARQYRDYPILKLKLGSEDDLVRVEAVRKARPDAGLYIDANAGWTPDQAVDLVRELSAFGVELVEQPVKAEDIEGMGYVQQKTDIPIVADESLRSLTDLTALHQFGVRGINLKIMKLGGLAPALDMLYKARELGFKIMLGCMAETSLGVTAMAHLSAWGDWFDLDAPLLIANDPFQGIRYKQADFQLPDRPGIGAELRER